MNPQEQNQVTYEAILAHIAKDPPARREAREFCGGGLLSSCTLDKDVLEPRIPWANWQALNLARGHVGRIVRASDLDLGKVGVLARDLHCNWFPGYVRISLVEEDQLNQYDSLAHHVPLQFSAGQYQGFSRKMKLAGKPVQLSQLPPCPQERPAEFTSFLENSPGYDAEVHYVNTPAGEQWAMYKSFKCHAGTHQNLHSSIAIAGCTWTLSRPHAGFPAVVMEVARFDPLAYFFADRAVAYEAYEKIA